MPVLGIHRPPEPEVGLHQERLADATLADDVDQCPVGREEPAPDRLHEEQPPAPGLLRHPRRLPGVERERLLAQDVLARPGGRRWCPPRGAVGRGHVDHVDVGIGGERVVVAVSGRDVEPVPERLGPLRRSGRHRRDGASLGPLHRLGEPGGDAPGPITPQRITVARVRRPRASHWHRDDAWSLPTCSGHPSLITLSSGPAWDNACLAS